MLTPTGLPKLIAMCGRRKGGKPKPPARILHGIAAHADVYLAYLTARGYSQSSIEMNRWALRQFSAWTQERGTDQPTSFTRADLEAYRLYLHHYRSPSGDKPLVLNSSVVGRPRRRLHPPPMPRLRPRTPPRLHL